MGCESEREIKELKETVQEKLGEDFDIAEPRKRKPKLKIININEDIMKLSNQSILETIKRQNEIEGKEGVFYIRLVKRIIKEKKDDKSQSGRRRKEDGSLIIEVDKRTHEQMINREKINIGWRKCRIFDYFNVKRCFKCWGYYHIAKNCTRQETCYKCAGSHRTDECKTTIKKCVNCMYKNKMYNLKINDNHKAINIECPIYIKAVEEEKKRTDWNIK